MYRVVVAMLTLILVGCAEPSIDASSRPAFDQSLDQVMLSLSEREQEAFSQALVIVAMADPEEPPEEVPEGLSPALAQFDGMTARDVMERAERLKRARRSEAEGEVSQQPHTE